jgi:hypothetical protein
MRQRGWLFEEAAKTQKQIFRVFLSTFGVTPNEYSADIIDQSLTLDDLF